MTKKTALVLLAGALALSACDHQPDRDDTETTTNAADQASAIPPQAIREAKTQCQIAAVAQGGTSEQATTLCNCVIDRIAEGKTVEEFAAVTPEQADVTLGECAAENGIEEVN